MKSLQKLRTANWHSVSIQRNWSKRNAGYIVRQCFSYVQWRLPQAHYYGTSYDTAGRKPYMKMNY